MTPERALVIGILAVVFLALLFVVLGDDAFAGSTWG